MFRNVQSSAMLLMPANGSHSTVRTELVSSQQTESPSLTAAPVLMDTMAALGQDPRVGLFMHTALNLLRCFFVVCWQGRKLKSFKLCDALGLGLSWVNNPLQDPLLVSGLCYAPS